jgi:hypothetical protein
MRIIISYDNFYNYVSECIIIRLFAVVSYLIQVHMIWSKLKTNINLNTYYEKIKWFEE